MSSYELTFGPVVSRPQRGADGRFLNGSTPHNKGKRWDDYLTPEQQRRSRTTCFSSTYRPANGYRPANSGVKPKPVICLDSFGRLYFFASLEKAAAVVNCTAPCIRRCCDSNRSLVPSRRFGRLNTDHMIHGLRFYYEADDEIYRPKLDVPFNTIKSETI